jgi:hypothetical protein
MKTYTAYLIGYEPAGLVLTKPFMREMIDAADFCIHATDGVPIGASFKTGPDLSSGKGGPKTGTLLRCIGHKHFGKVLVLEEVQAS